MGSGIMVAVLVGTGIAVQVAIIGRASSATNPLTVSLALQLAGSAAAAAWATSRGAWADVGVVAREWWWMPLGVGGWIFVAGIAYASRQTGAAIAVSVLVAAQVTAGLGLDAASGTRVIGMRHLVGAALIATGVVVLALADRPTSVT